MYQHTSTNFYYVAWIYISNTDLQNAFFAFDLNSDNKISVSELSTVLRQLIPSNTLNALEKYSSYDAIIQNYVIRLFNAKSTCNNSPLFSINSSSSPSSLTETTPSQFGSQEYITFNQFRVVTSELRRILRERSIASSFQYFDVDNSGFISAGNLSNVVKQVIKKHPMMSNDEYEHLILRNVKILINYGDKDGNGVIDLEEFVEICEKLEDVKWGKVIQAWAKQCGVQIPVV